MNALPPAIAGGNADVRRSRVHAAVDLLLDALLDAAEPAAPPAPGPAHEPLADKREVSRLFGVSPATIDRLVRAGMPYVPVGDVRRYDVAACRAWLVQHGQRRAEAPASASRPRAASASTIMAAGESQGGAVRLLSKRAR